MSNILFDIRSLDLSIGKKKILNSLSLKIYNDDYLAIIGPNGSGKTTLIKCLIGILTPPPEKIFFKNNPIEKIEQKTLAKQISYVPQVNEQSFPFTVKEFLMLARYPHFSRFTSVTPDDKKAVAKSMKITGTLQFAERQINTLSGGEKQMVFIAAALAQGGEIILLDEPATFLDPKHEQKIYEILRTIHSQEKKAIVTITHNINSAILYSKKIAIVRNGEIFYYGTSNSITENNILEKAYNKKFTFIRHPNTEQKIILPEVL